MKRAALILLAFMVLIPSAGVSAQENGFVLTLDREQVKRGENVRLTLSFSGEIGAFLADVDYGNLEYVKTEASAGGNYTQTYDDGGETHSVFTLKRGNSLSGAVFTWIYRVPEEPEGDVLNFTVRLSQLVDADGIACMEDADLTAQAEIAPLPSSEAGLLALSPSYGAFDEEFSADTFHYTLAVPYDIRQLSFDWVCTEGATAAVNRRNLGSGGSVSRFLITVTAADGQSKSTYTVDVTRGVYVRPTPTPGDGGESPEPERTPKPTATPKPVKTPKPTATPKPAKTPKPTASKASPAAKAGTAAKPSSSKGASSKVKTGSEGKNGYPESGQAGGAGIYEDTGNYTESAPLVVQSDSIMPYVAGIATGIAAVAVGALAAVLLMRGSSNKHEPKHDEKRP